VLRSLPEEAYEFGEHSEFKGNADQLGMEVIGIAFVSPMLAEGDAVAPSAPVSVPALVSVPVTQTTPALV
jgi:hypothetical protein